MVLLEPLLAIVSSAVLGAAIVALLSCKPRYIAPWMGITVFSILGIVWWTSFFQHWDLPIALICASSGVGGYYAMTNRLLNLQGPRQLPEIHGSQKSNPGHISVVYVTHGESEEYDQVAWARQFKEFDHQELRFIPYLARPFFFAILRSKYMKVGKSRHRSIHEVMMRKVKEELEKRKGKDIRFYLSFLDDEPRPDVAAAKAFNEGARTIIVCRVFLTTSNHTAEADDQVKSLRLEERGVRLRFTEPLWNSEKLRRSFLEKANAIIPPEERANTGILLVGHGQPHEWDLEFPTETEQEMKFREDLLKDFEKEGYRRENLSLAWMAFREPKVPDVVKAMAARGLKRIIYFSAAISAEAIHSQSDIPELVAKAKVSKTTETVNMGAWNDHPLVIEAIREKIEEALDIEG